MITSLDGYRHQHCRYRSANNSCVVPPDAVSDTFDLDRVIVRAGHRYDVEQCAIEPESAFEAAQAFDVDVDEPPVHLESV